MSVHPELFLSLLQNSLLRENEDQSSYVERLSVLRTKPSNFNTMTSNLNANIPSRFFFPGQKYYKIKIVYLKLHSIFTSRQQQIMSYISLEMMPNYAK